MAIKTVGEKIKDLLYEKKMTQTELAKKIKVYRQVLVNWLNGVRNPKIENLQKIADVLDVSVDELLEDTSRKYNRTLTEDKENFYKENLKIKEQEIKVLKKRITFLENKIKLLEKKK